MLADVLLDFTMSLFVIAKPAFICKCFRALVTRDCLDMSTSTPSTCAFITVVNRIATNIIKYFHFSFPFELWETPNIQCAPEWQKLREWHSPKSLDRKIVIPNMRYFVAILRFVAVYAFFGRLWAKDVLFRVKTGFLGQEVHFYYISYTTVKQEQRYF